jgi:hypothetical protein
MKFFIPAAKDAAQAEDVYRGIVQFAKLTTSWQTTARRIFGIRYRHDGREYYSEVGKEDPRVHELVIAILESEAYLICTFNRGVKRGEPVLVGKKEIVSITDFENAE